MGVHIALSNIADPDTDQLFVPGDIIPDDVLAKFGDAIDEFYVRRQLFTLCDDPLDEPGPQWRTWGGAYPDLLRQIVLKSVGEAMANPSGIVVLTEEILKEAVADAAEEKAEEVEAPEADSPATPEPKKPAPKSRTLIKRPKATKKEND